MLRRAANRLPFAFLIATGAVPAAAQAVGSDLHPALLDAVVNGHESGEPTLFLRGPDDTLYASAATISGWRMRLPPGEPVSLEGQLFYRITALPGLEVELSELEQRVAIDATPHSFELQRTSLSHAPSMAMTAPASGAFLNYDLLGEHVQGHTNVSGAIQAGLFTPHGVGEASFIASAGDGEERLVRLETSWTIDRPEDATSIRFGDSVSSAGPGAIPVRFAGLQYRRNYAVQPGFITMPLPSGSGTAAIPSVVDVYVNHALQSSQQVGAGPFELSNIPVQSGGGNVQIVVRDLLGREVVSEHSYYASQQQLRRGLHDFSYEAGFARRGFGRRSHSYGEFLASTTHRYGLTDRITIEGHAQASRSRQMAGAAISFLAFDLAQLGGSVSISHSDKGIGFRAAGSFERRSRRWSVGVRSEFHSAAYAAIGLSDHHRPPKLMVQAFSDLTFARGSIGFNVVHRSLRDREDETLAGVTASYRISPAIGVQLFARHVVAGRQDTIFGIHLAVALGGRRSASASIEHDQDGTSGYFSYQDDAPAGGGYRLAGSFGEAESVEASYVHNFRQTRLAAHASHANGLNGLRLSASGSIGLLGGRAFVSRSLGESFARVEVSEYPGVRVYADNQLIGTTDRNGSILVPALRAYDRNVIRIEETDLPLDTMVKTVELSVRPFARAGTRIRFEAERERGVLMRVQLENGQDLPAGALVSLVGQPEMHVVASDGEVYVPHLVGTATLTASWEGQSCRFVAQVPQNDDPQPRLGPLVCRRGPIYAEM